MGYEIRNGNAVPYLGTCFFIRHNQKLYLITAKHVIMPCKQGERRPLITNITIEDNNGYPTKMIPVNVAPYFDTSHCTPDIIAINIPDNFNANSVEQFLFSNFKQVDEVHIYGYPGIEYKRYGDSTFVYSKANHLTITNANNKFFRSYTDSINEIKDTLIFGIETPNKMIEPYTDKKLGGFSGSPVFIKDANSTKWRVGGAFVASSEDSTHTKTALWVTEIKYAIKQMSN